MDLPAVLVGTDEGLRTLGADVAPLLTGQSIDHVAVAAGGIWAISEGRTVWHDPAPSPGRPVGQATEERANCLLVIDDRVLVGGSGASLFELVDGEALRLASFDEAPGRAAWYTPWGGPPDVRSMARDVDGSWYVNVHVGGVVRSTNDGGSWTDTMDIEADVHQVIADPGRAGRAYAASARGLAVTTDGANTWEFLTEGLHSTYCRAVAVSALAVFVSASRGPRGRDAAVYRRPRSGGTFERCIDGLPAWFSTNIDTFCLAARDRFAVAGDRNGTLYASDDDGATWQVAAAGLPGIRCLALA